MSRTQVLGVGLALAVAAAAGTETVLYEETFDAPSATVAGLGWEVRATPEQSRWDIAGGALQATCFFKPYQGGLIQRRIPYTPRGEFAVDLLLAGAGSTPGYDHFSLTLRLGTLSVSSRGYGEHSLQRYYSNEHRVVATEVPKGGWVRFRIRYDAPRGLIEYACGDLDHPSLVEHGFSVQPLAASPDGTIELQIGNYGLSTGTLVHRIDNIRLSKLPDAVGASAAPPGIAVIRGLAFDRLRVPEIVSRLGDDQPDVFTILSMGAAEKPANRFRLDRLPSIFATRRWRTILMADVPLGPGEPLPAYLLRKIRDDVEQGAHLIVLGGAFTLEKGCFQESLIEELLPVELPGVWGWRRPAEALPIRSRLPSPAMPADAPRVACLHAVQPRPGADVLAWAGDWPLAVTRPFGRGHVTVFAGAPLNGTRAAGKMFWEWEHWPEFVAALCRMPGEAR